MDEIPTEGLRQGTDLRLQELTRAALDLVRDIQEHLAGPVAPDHEIRTWPLWAASEDGGIWCGDDGCPLTVENSEIGDFRDGNNFTLDELHTAIGQHISARRDREGDG